MDCRQASSCVCDPSGKVIHEAATEDFRGFFVHLQLTAEGVIDNVLRRKRMADRRTQCYHDCYLNMQPIRDLTGFLDLPQPGVLNIHGIVPGKKEHPMDALLNHIPGITEDSENLILLPPFAYSETSLEKISGIARRKNTCIVLCSPNYKGQYIYLFRKTGKFRHWEIPPRPLASDRELLRFDFGPARVHLTCRICCLTRNRLWQQQNKDVTLCCYSIKR
jgi:hypothetical protein